MATITLDQQTTISEIDAAASAAREAYNSLVTAKPAAMAKAARAYMDARAAVIKVASAFGQQRRKSRNIAAAWAAFDGADAGETYIGRVQCALDATSTEATAAMLVDLVAKVQVTLRELNASPARIARADSVASDGQTKARSGSMAALIEAHAPSDVWAYYSETDSSGKRAHSVDAHAIAHAYVPSNLLPCKDCRYSTGAIVFRTIKGIDAINER